MSATETARKQAIALVAAGWSQVKLAKLIGVRQPTISRLIKGETQDVKSSIADAIGRLYWADVKRGKVA